MNLSISQLKACMPFISREVLSEYEARMLKFLDPINQTLTKYEISTPERACCFISQVAHESGRLRYVKELATGEAYEGRKDLGNTQAGDGVKFKGRGLIQTTGRSNYLLTGTELGLDLINHPELLELPINAALSAGFFWKRNKLNDICDQAPDWTHVWKGKAYTRFSWLTVRINGGLNGYDDRLNYYQLAKKVIF